MYRCTNAAVLAASSIEFFAAAARTDAPGHYCHQNSTISSLTDVPHSHQFFENCSVDVVQFCQQKTSQQSK